MKALSILFGIILAIFGVSLMATPLMNYLQIANCIAILLMTYGIFGLATAVMLKKYELNLVYSALSLIGGIIIAAVPGIRILMEMVGVYVIAAWIIIQGALAIAGCVKAKRNGKSLWWLILIFGITTLLLGIYSFMHPLLTAVLTGILIGLYFLQAGINMFFMSDNIE